MQLRSDSVGCCNLNCPKSLRDRCETAVPVGTGGAKVFVPKRHGCDEFSDKNRTL